MERISTIQTESVITQSVDAVERPMTLIEKLEREYQKWCEHEDKSEFGSGEAIDARGRTRGLLSAIEVAKQYSEWVGVDERLPPDNMMVLAYCHIRKVTGYAFVSNQQAWSFYHFTKNSENQAMAMVNDISKWMPIPQPPTEVRDD